MKQKIVKGYRHTTVKGYLSGERCVEEEGYYVMSKSLTIVVEEIEKRTGFKVVNYITEQRPLRKELGCEFYEWCILEREDEVENVEISHYYNKGEEEPYGEFHITADLEDSARIRNDKYNLFFDAGRYVVIDREDLVSDEEFLKLLEE